VSTNSGSTWSNISGATGAALTLTNVQQALDNNRYRCIVTNAHGGSIMSNAATLTVTGSETIEAPPPPNNHSPWAAEELGRAFYIEEIVPPLLREPSVDLTQSISRREFAGIVVMTYENLTGTRINVQSTNPFTDSDDIYVRMAYELGLMVGVQPNKFAPNTILNRETAATALTRVFKKWHFTNWTYETDTNFSLSYTRPAPFSDDRDISSWAYDSVYFMAANGIVGGIGNNLFAPRAVTSEQVARGYANNTREQAIVIALRLVENY
jgi:hypothetical protein